MEYVRLLLTILSLVNRFAGWLERRKLIREIEADIIRRNTDAASKELQTALDARIRIRAVVERNYGSLRDKDKFERED
jgi:hypothetical protein